MALVGRWAGRAVFDQVRLGLGVTYDASAADAQSTGAVTLARGRTHVDCFSSSRLNAPMKAPVPPYRLDASLPPDDDVIVAPPLPLLFPEYDDDGQLEEEAG